MQFLSSATLRDFRHAARYAVFLDTIARLKSGATLVLAQTQIDSVAGFVDRLRWNRPRQAIAPTRAIISRR